HAALPISRPHPGRADRRDRGADAAGPGLDGAPRPPRVVGAGTPAPGSRPLRAPRGGAHGGGAGTGEGLSSRGAGVLPAERRWCARGARGTVPPGAAVRLPAEGPGDAPCPLPSAPAAVCLRPRRRNVVSPPTHRPPRPRIGEARPRLPDTDTNGLPLSRRS